MSYTMNRMNRLIKFWKVVILDFIGLVLMLAAILTGWLPGPGGIPLFILGLSLLAINHDWAQRYIDEARDITKKAGNFIFRDTPGLQILYDVVSPIMLGTSIVLTWGFSELWQLSLGVVVFFLGMTLLLGNRNRWAEIKARFKRKL